MRFPLNTEKAKEKARKLELKGQIDKAISQYAKILEDLEGSPELTDELALYNKLGDLYLKRGDVASAIEQYETAVTHYAEQGFPNNAIALCNKVLRNAPGRTHVYLKLAKLMMQRGFVAEAKQNLLEYAERMQKAGQIEDAFHALKEFADLSPDNEEIRLLLAEQLKNAARTEEAREQLAKLYHEAQQSGDTRRARKTLERMKAIDPEYDVEGAPAPQLKSRKQKSSDIVFIDLDEDRAGPDTAAVVEHDARAGDQPLRVEPTSLGEGLEVVDSESAQGLFGVERTAHEADIDADAAGVEQLDGLDLGEDFATVDADDVQVVEIEPTTLDDPLLLEDEAGDGVPMIEMPPDEVVGDAEVEELVGLVAESESPPQPFMDGAGSVDYGANVGIDESKQPRDGAEEELFGGESIEAGVEVPELDVEGFEGVPESEEVGEDMAPLADLPIIDTGEEEETPVDVAAAPDELAEAEVEEEFEAEPELAETPVDLAGATTADGGDAVELLTEYELETPEEVPPELGEAVDTAGAVTGSAVAAPDIAELEARVLDDPGAPEPHRELGEALIEAGERERGLEELEIALSAFEEVADWRRAQSVAEVILRVEPNSVHHHQKRVEYSYTMEDRRGLAAAYLELADALLRSGSADRAQVVYRRVLEHDPDSDRARVALETLQPEEAAGAEEVAGGSDEATEPEAVGEAAEVSKIGQADEAGAATRQAAASTGADFVDLGALILEEEQARDTRMRIQHGEPTGDEERDFQIMLSEFKKGIDANIELDDTQAHYDLGVAFREMGLLDEAISEFQKALRGTQGRLRTAEALGLCFFDKGQFAVAGTVLRRAVDSEPGGDDHKIGLLYWLGRCEEEQGRSSQALSYYQRIFSIDIGFQDVRERVMSLAKAGG
ncbi:MAG: tetratricopeptide repeat protein [Gemmatimonadota bacterium]|nr:MAG: tetratricopeptide repeat protein [Gemmatimonadota bacterium]